MQRLVLTVAMTGLFVTFAWSAEVVVFVDGSRIEVTGYEVKGGLVLLTTPEGLRSVPRTYIDLEATQRANRGATVQAPRQAPPPRPAEQPPKTEPAPVPPPAADIAPEPVQPSPEPSQPTPALAPPAVDRQAVPPPVWTNDELNVSLVVPTAAWHLQNISASYDVAVRLDQPQTGAMATLGLIRQRMRNYKDFQKVVEDVDRSIAAAPGYQSLASTPLHLEPYMAYELRYLKGVEGVNYFNRMVIYYSRDLAYVLSLSCPQSSQEQSRADFDSLVKGLVIKKVRKDITPKGAPKT